MRKAAARDKVAGPFMMETGEKFRMKVGASAPPGVLYLKEPARLINRGQRGGLATWLADARSADPYRTLSRSRAHACPVAQFPSDAPLTGRATRGSMAHRHTLQTGHHDAATSNADRVAATPAAVGCTRATLMRSTSLQSCLKWSGNLFKMHRDGNEMLSQA